MNEGFQVFHRLSTKQREKRLRRSGVEAALTSQEKRGVPNKTALGKRVQLAIGTSSGLATLQELHRLCYRVYVYNLAVVHILPLRAGAGMTAASPDMNARIPVIPSERRGLRKLLERLAVRALYSVGLDSGEVLLLAKGDRQYVVRELVPLVKELNEQLHEPYLTAELALARDLAQETPGRPRLVMGMDPEFLLQRGRAGSVVPASLYLPMDGVAGCDAGPPGTRGAFPVAELRPRPRGEPGALLAQLMSAAATADRLIADRALCWRAGGMPLRGWALGGHLHFSGVTLTAPLLRALDNYLALPMLLLEDARAMARRPRYGVLGDFRYQPHGGFEYRTLPSFLVSPVVAKGAVYLAHLIVSHYELLPLRPLDREDLHVAYYSGDKPPLRVAFAPLMEELRSLGGYKEAARYVEPLFSYIDQGKTWDESRDIRKLWCKASIGESIVQ